MPTDSTLPDADQLAQRNAGVLSNVDLRNEIKVRQLVSTDDSESCEDTKGVSWSCYDMRVGSVIGKRLGVVNEGTSVILRPGELVTLLSKEWVDLPRNITGLVIPRNKMAQRGILILNAGHVDPGWKGQIMAQIVNMSDQDRAIFLNDFKNGIFSVIFSYLHSETTRDLREQQLSQQEREGGLHAVASEQSETLVLAESRLREHFVALDRFPNLIWTQLIGMLAILATVVVIFSGWFIITGSEIAGVEWDVYRYGSLLFVTTLGVFAGAGLYDWLSNKVMHIPWLSRRHRRNR